MSIAHKQFLKEHHKRERDAFIEIKSVCKFVSHDEESGTRPRCRPTMRPQCFKLI